MIIIIYELSQFLYERTFNKFFPVDLMLLKENACNDNFEIKLVKFEFIENVNINFTISSMLTVMRSERIVGVCEITRKAIVSIALQYHQ